MTMMKDKIRNAASPARFGRMALLAAILLCGVGSSLSQASTTDGRPLSASELLLLVKDRTWQWSEGAGRFFGDGRRFIAFSRGDDGPSYGEGRFRLTDSGRLCLVADWHTPAGAKKDKTCFLHKEADGVIYQRREGSGDWYPFKHSPVLDTDEYAKFTDKDLVSEEVAKIKAEVDAKTANQKGNQQ